MTQYLERVVPVRAVVVQPAKMATQKIHRMNRSHPYVNFSPEARRDNIFICPHLR